MLPKIVMVLLIELFALPLNLGTLDLRKHRPTVKKTPIKCSNKNSGSQW
jgi:hypothetical protein